MLEIRLGSLVTRLVVSLQHVWERARNWRPGAGKVRVQLYPEVYSYTEQTFFLRLLRRAGNAN